MSLVRLNSSWCLDFLLFWLFFSLLYSSSHGQCTSHNISATSHYELKDAPQQGEIQKSDGRYFAKHFAHSFVKSVVSTSLSKEIRGRNLSAKDFQDLNEILFETVLSIPDTSIVVDISGFDLYLDASNIECTHIKLHDINVTPQQQNRERLVLVLDVQRLDLDCTLDFKYSYTFLRGSGRGSLDSKGSRLNSTIAFGTSPEYYGMPTSASVETCDPKLEVTEVVLNGDLISTLVTSSNLAKSLLPDNIQGVVCEMFDNVVNTLINYFLEVASGMLEPYITTEETSTTTEASTDPLALEKSLVVPENTNLIDIRENHTELGGLLDFALQQARKQLSSVVDDENAPTNGNGKDLGINSALRAVLLDDDRAFSLKNSDLFVENEFRLGLDTGLLFNANASVSSVKIFGLDTLTTFEPLDRIGAYTLQNHLSWEKLFFEVDLLLHIEPYIAPGSFIKSIPEDVDKVQKLTVKIGVSNPNVTLSLLLALDESKLGNLTVGSLMHLSQILPCVSTATHAFQISQLSLQLDSIIMPTVESVKHRGLDGILSNMLDALYILYNDVLLSALPNIAQTTVVEALNKVMERTVSRDGDTLCSQPRAKSSDALVDFRDLLLSEKQSQEFGGEGNSPYGKIIPGSMDFLRQTVLKTNPVDGTSVLNDWLLAPLTQTLSGVPGRLYLPSNIFPEEQTVDLMSLSLTFGAYDSYIENVDSLGAPLSLLNPVVGEPHSLYHRASFGVGKPLRGFTTIILSLDSGDEMTMANELQISFELTGVNVFAVTLVKLLEERIFNFPLKDILEVNCWLASLRRPILDATGLRVAGTPASASIEDIALNISGLGLNITCINCTNDVESITERISSPEGNRDAKDFILDMTAGLLQGQFLQGIMDRALAEATSKCPHTSQYDLRGRGGGDSAYAPFELSDQTPESAVFQLFLVFGCVIVVAIILFASVKFLISRKHHRWLHSLSNEDICILRKEQNENDRMEKELNQITKSIARSTEIPFAARTLIPIVILANIGFFLSGHLSLGATVDLKVELAGRAMEFPSFYELTMLDFIVDLWRMNARMLSSLLFIISVAWPYTKQLITLALWFLPPRLVSISKRGLIFQWLDVLSKWSMVDVFVLLIAVVAFHISIDSPSVGFLPQNFYSMDAAVVLKWGLYANMIAQLVSQVSSHFIIHYHRKIVAIATTQYDNGRQQALSADSTFTSTSASQSNDLESVASNGNKSGEILSAGDSKESPEAIHKHSFIVPHRTDGRKARVRHWWNGIIVGWALVAAVLLVAGCFFPSYSIEILGLLGVAIEVQSNADDAITHYSVLDIVADVMDQATARNDIRALLGMGSMSCVLIGSVLVVPIILLIALLVQWFVPMHNETRRNRLEVATEILQAWQYVEVYIVSIAASTWQLGNTSSLMINRFCGSLDDTFATMVYFGLLDRQDAQCFTLHAELGTATYLLIGAAVMLGALTTLVKKAVNQCFRDKSSTLALGKKSSFTERENEDTAVTKDIRPVGLQFTDLFGFMLRVEDP